ncbi:hypothetical protein DASC09_059990 [Saccharomycopsis crataegensis]|uniref:Auxin efflux carrier n=1 Tax=Saccharomycopsis crataegensis TaxID=43959 RepID=A0AAV5QX13_9ASCO|nr:hypothetical protein DASC09_059990 [Saccharomycopsis crataegensis]
MADAAVTLSLSTAIWSSVKPILKIYFIIFTGFVLARKNILTVETCRNLSDLVVTVALPSLTFSKLVANLSYEDAKSIGVLSFTCVLCLCFGGIFGFILNYITPVPKVFYYGLICSGMFANIGDLPIAFIQSIPSVIFDSSMVDKGVAYICIFSFAMMFVFFNLGCANLIGLDFKNDDDDELPCDVTSEDKDAGDGEVSFSSSSSQIGNSENPGSVSAQHSASQARPRALSSASRPAASILTLETSGGVDGILHEYSQFNDAEERNAIDPLDQLSVVRTHTKQQQEKPDVDNNDTESLKTVHKKSFVEKFHLSPLLFVLRNFKRPASISVIAGLTVCLIPWLKALFVGYHNHVDYPNAPDGKPALHFIIDITSTIGNAQVPLGLTILGATLGRLEFKTVTKGLVITSLAMAFVRLVVMPIIGAALMTKFKHLGWFNDDMATFLAVLNWGLPSMTVLVYITAFFTPNTGPHVQMDCVAIILLTQYAFLIISFPILTTYTLKHILSD